MLKIKHVYFLRPFFDNRRIFSCKNIELANEHRKNAHLQQPLIPHKKEPDSFSKSESLDSFD